MITYNNWKIVYWSHLYNMFKMIDNKKYGETEWDDFDRFCIFVFKKDNNIH